MSIIKHKTKTKIMKTLLECNDDRDPISMTLFWIEEKGIRTIVYPKEQLKELVFYSDSKKHIRCFEKESLIYLKSYNITNHPITTEPFPEELFKNIDVINLEEKEKEKTLEEFALDVFQYFSNISIFIDYNWFLELDRKQLIKFNYELRDFWLQNFSDEQRNNISNISILSKHENDMMTYDIIMIQKYLLSQMKILLECTMEEYKYMINYILLGALGIVIPKIKKLYPDFDLAF